MRRPDRRFRIVTAGQQRSRKQHSSAKPTHANKPAAIVAQDSQPISIKPHLN
jgi:hypothetical protein